jgi:hypothetical protein
MGGSILPVTIHNNKIYFLFGKERDSDENPGWSDFGGGTDKGETFIQTAIREGGEELTGFLGTDNDLRKMLSKYGTYNIDYKSEGYSTYRCHIFPIQYDEMLPRYYNNNQQFLQKRLDKKIIRDTKIFEKTQIKWFSFDDITKHHNEFRTFYKNIVKQILQDKSAIEAFVRTKSKTKSKTKVKRIRTNKTRKKQLNTRLFSKIFI